MLPLFGDVLIGSELSTVKSILCVAIIRVKLNLQGWYSRITLEITEVIYIFLNEKFLWDMKIYVFSMISCGIFLFSLLDDEKVTVLYWSAKGHVTLCLSLLIRISNSHHTYILKLFFFFSFRWNLTHEPSNCRFLSKRAIVLYYGRWTWSIFWT